MRARIAPTRLALEFAYGRLRVSMALDDMLRHPTYRPILENLARSHMLRCARTDLKKLQANDHDD